MALKTKVKVSEVNNLSDARYCAGMGVDLIGFSVDINNPKFLSADKLSAIANWLSGIEVVLEFESFDKAVFEALSEQISINYIQYSSAEHLAEAKAMGLPLIQKIMVNDLESLTQQITSSEADLILLESTTHTTLEAFTQVLQSLSLERNILLGFGIVEEQVNEAIDTIQPYGIALKGGEEIKPGLKSFEEISSILEVLEID